MTDSDKDLDWLTETDEDILKVLWTRLILSPSIIAANTERSRVSVSRRLDTLQAGGLVEKVDRGKYKISDKGAEVVENHSSIEDNIFKEI
jgi:Mn-dependent DtxR family transcriptional regulator